MTRLRRARIAVGRLALGLDEARLFFERRWKVAVVLMVLLSALAVIQSYETSQDEASRAHAQALSAKRQSIENRDTIANLIEQRDIRRRILDLSRYHAALNGCRRQNVARRGSNQIVDVIRAAFAPAAAEERAGVPQTPLVHRLIFQTAKLKILPIIPCRRVIPNPALLDPPPKHQ